MCPERVACAIAKPLGLEEFDSCVPRAIRWSRLVWSSNKARHFCVDLLLTSLVKQSNYLIKFSTDFSLTLMSTKRGKNMLLIETITATTSKNQQNPMSYPTSRECEGLVFCWMQFYRKNCLVSNCQSKALWILSPQNYITTSSS